MKYQQPPDDPKMRSEIDDLYEALFKSLGESTNRVDVVINVLLRMTCAIAVEHGADKDTMMGATEACFDATLAAKVLHDKYESTLQ
jgi:hypothetical protein